MYGRLFDADFSDEEAIDETFACMFRSAEHANLFKARFEEFCGAVGALKSGPAAGSGAGAGAGAGAASAPLASVSETLGEGVERAQVSCAIPRGVAVLWCCGVVVLWCCGVVVRCGRGRVCRAERGRCLFFAVVAVRRLQRRVRSCTGVHGSVRWFDGPGEAVRALHWQGILGGRQGQCSVCARR